MNKIKNTLKQIWSDESGQGATEYILILVVVSVLVIAFRDPIKKMIVDRTDEVSTRLKGAITEIN